MEAKKKGIIYKYTSPSRRVYIGQTKYESKRKSNHKNKTSKSDTIFGRAIKKYGFENFKYEVLFRCNSISIKRLSIILDTMEIYFIKKYDTIKNGYNITSGGHVTIVNEETKTKISNTLKGRTFSNDRKKNISDSLMGRTMSEETRLKISKGRKGIIFTDEHKSHMGITKRKSICQYDKNNKFIKEWESIISASKELNINQSNIILVYKGIRQSAGKFIWKYKEI